MTTLQELRPDFERIRAAKNEPRPAEAILEALSRNFRSRIALSPIVSNMAGVTLVGIK